MEIENSGSALRERAAEDFSVRRSYAIVRVAMSATSRYPRQLVTTANRVLSRGPRREQCPGWSFQGYLCRLRYQTTSNAPDYLRGALLLS